ncbi:MAG TPA: diguanylate cyclase [Methylomirabilota bacterium]|nr:diguanylate cyclase [Methylomirabilota bacterium]
MYVRFWGTRGSIAAPGEHTARYGGNTSCVEVRAGDGTVIVLDCGTGARELGLHLVRTMPSPVRLHLFIGHTHWDHIQGFPFFVPAFLPGAELNVYAPLGFQQSLEEAMSGQMEYSYFPVKLRDLRSRIHFTELEEGFFRVGDVLVETQYLNHTAPTIAYRMTNGGASVAYVTDHEPFWASEDGVLHHPGDQRHIAFMRGADLAIHDAQYSAAEYVDRLGWGHSTIEYATDVALAAGVKRLALFHHDPGHDDRTLERLEAEARTRVIDCGGVLDVFAAREGQELSVSGSRPAAPAAEISALRRRLIAGARVLVVTSDDTQVATIEEALAGDGMVALPVPDMHAALTRGTEYLPDLAIVDTGLPPGDGADLVPAFRSRLGRANFPVILLAERPEVTALHRPEIGATDYLAKPYSPPMLRARVRAWLARTLVAYTESAALGAADASVAVEDARDDRGATQTLLASMLASVPLFKCLAPAQLNTLVARASEQVYPSGHVIARQGEPPQHLWVLLSGRVRVVETTTDGQAEMLLGEIGKAEVFGELGILRDQPRSATVIAVEQTHCLVLRHVDFAAALGESVQLANGLLRVVASRLYDADRKLARYAPDPLTGLYSRRAFHELYRRSAATARRRATGLVLLALDVVHLKAVNDAFGYTLGDEVLRTVADALTEATRTTDVVARYGGDEFAVLLLDARTKDADIIVGRVRDKLGALAAQRRLPVAVECATGIAWSDPPPDTAEEFLGEADRDMHARKVRENARRETA